MLFLFDLFGNFRILSYNNLLLDFHSGPIQFFCVLPLLIHVDEGHELLELVGTLFLFIFGIFVDAESDGLLPPGVAIVHILVIFLRVVLVLHGFLQNRLLLRRIQISSLVPSRR